MNINRLHSILVLALVLIGSTYSMNKGKEKSSDQHHEKTKNNQDLPHQFIGLHIDDDKKKLSLCLSYQIDSRRQNSNNVFPQRTSHAFVFLIFP